VDQPVELSLGNCGASRGGSKSEGCQRREHASA
jgi:hypothetical protein